MVVQRKTKNLGLNRSRDKRKIYRYIEKELRKKEKFCTRGNKGKLGRFGLKHEGKNPLTIRQFYLLDVYINPSGNVIINKGDGLQGACIKCDKAYRRARINRWSKKYSNMTKEKINEEYRNNYGKLKHCTPCDKDKTPEKFPISITMETGLHNSCIECTKAYSESVGSRWEIYSPDGHNVIRIHKRDSCKMCGSKIKLHKDHIFPISKGGTDNKENIQILCGKHNLQKSATLIGLTSIYDIDDKMICGRYEKILKKSKKDNWDLNKFELRISKAVKDFIIHKRDMSDIQLKNFFNKEKAKNNRKHSVEHAIKKFRQYCGTAILEINEILSKDN